MEVLVACSLVTILAGTGMGALWWARGASERALSPGVATQARARRALVDLTLEVQEAVEIVRPPPGATLDHVLFRDKLNRLVVLYPVREGDGLSLRAFRRDPLSPDGPGEDRLLLSAVRRVAFTSLAPGMLQVHLSVQEAGKVFPLVTSIRCRNAPLEGDL